MKIISAISKKQKIFSRSYCKLFALCHIFLFLRVDYSAVVGQIEEEYPVYPLNRILGEDMLPETLLNGIFFFWSIFFVSLNFLDVNPLLINLSEAIESAVCLQTHSFRPLTFQDAWNKITEFLTDLEQKFGIQYTIYLVFFFDSKK